MAEAILTLVLENLSSLIQNQIGSVLGVEKEMEKMSSMLSIICAVIEDAEERQLTDRSIKNWLQKLEDVSSELEDVLDDCEAEAFRLEENLEQNHQWVRKVRSSLSYSSPKHIYFRHTIARKMKEIGDRLDQIGNERVNFHLREFAVGERRRQIRESRQTGSVISQPHVYGREEDKERAVGFLINDAVNCSGTSVYCIVGLGGMGKTTLAQWVFNDERVSNHFELRMWVCVSEEFDVRRLIKAIIESGTGKACEALEMDPLQKQLQNMLRRKRFLIVLDDVWNEDHEEWDKLRYVMECGSNGASVVVTTRLKKVASIMGTVAMHGLTGLSDDDCWLLFKQRAFGSQREEQPNLIEIGKEIVKKCKGVPLAAKALGGLMCFKSEEEEWLSVMRSELWNLPEDKTSILPALRLSYLHLPVEHRRCFSYCAIFPKDYRIIKTQLIYLWMANGLISSKPELEVEDVGNEIFSELYWRSFFQDVEDDFRNDYFYKIHDLFHDLAQSIMGDKCRTMEVNDDTLAINLPKRVRHLSCTSSSQFRRTVNIPSTQSLRTFMVLTYPSKSYSTVQYDNIRNLHSLRVFDGGYGTPHLSSLVSNLKHLRYLNLSRSTIEVLPDSICLLHHLLALDLTCCRNLQKLPKQMIRLKGLRHLYIEGCDKLSHLPPYIGQLTCLKTLTNFIVDRRKGCQLDELNHLDIEGSLQISNLKKVKNPAEARFANLSQKKNLKRLDLSWHSNENESEENAKHVLDALAPSTELRWLNISNYNGTHFPHWFGKLTSLQDLHISGMKLVQYIDNDICHGDLRRSFGCLERLFIRNLPNLEGFSRQEVGNEMFRCLSTLDVVKCPKLTLPKLGSVKSLDVRNVGQHVLKSISNLHGLTRLHINGDDNIQELPIDFLTGLGTLEHLNLSNFPELKCLPEGMFRDCSSLKSICINSFTKIQELPIDFLNGLNTLEHLEISNFELKCLPEGMFRDCSSLKSIKIISCKKIQALPESFRDLTVLESMKLVECPVLKGFPSGLNQLISQRTLYMSGITINWSSRAGYSYSHCASHKLVVLPEALQHLSSLEYLNISFFLELATLPDWLENLRVLKELYIKGCPDLESLPMSMQRLTNLKKLSIQNCPKLEKRCEKGKGEDWHKISHIPDVYVSHFDDGNNMNDIW
ncbi:putative disease resistance protein RGA4 [Humulus lupulus]|uniref:putative disease resistance protein RGA4 n=1 Tax=Humulus lupulus TaxID=3486 RepID=UPI002B408B65|nr:putative disease resistance protein RGA4 [Humulus lupulus]